MERWAELLADHNFEVLAARRYEQARPEILTYLLNTAKCLPREVRLLLPEINDLEEFEPSQAMIDDLDGMYFRLEEAGVLDKAGYAFSAARFAAACLMFRQASSTGNLMEAAYEAWHAQAPTVR